MTFPTATFATFLEHRKQFIQIKDTESYRRARVQLHWKGIVLRDEVEGALVKTKAQQIARQGELLVAEIDAKVGGVGIVPRKLDGAIVSSHYFLFEIDESKCLRPWLDWFIKSGGIGDQFAARGSTNYAAIRPHHVLNCEIPLPLLEEQRRIISRIEELATKIKECQQLRKESLETSSSFITSLHVGLSGKRLRSLRDILTLDERRVPIRLDGTYPQIGINGFGGGLFARGCLDGTQTTYKEFNQLFDGALVLSQVKGWEGAIAVCGEQFAGWYASPEYRTFNFISDEASPEYMSAIVQSPWFYSKLASLTRGVGARRERTRPEAFLEMKIPMPTVEQQYSALQAVKKLKILQKIQSETSAELDALMPSILSKAFRGDL
jgi:type I restriction enzyme, S subunit